MAAPEDRKVVCRLVVNSFPVVFVLKVETQGAVVVDSTKQYEEPVLYKFIFGGLSCAAPLPS